MIGQVAGTSGASTAVDTPIWTLTKEGRAASAVVRISPGGPELRFLVDGELLWSMVLREPGAVGRMAAEKRAEFEARGWR